MANTISLGIAILLFLLTIIFTIIIIRRKINKKDICPVFFISVVLMWVLSIIEIALYLYPPKG